MTTIAAPPDRQAALVQQDSFASAVASVKSRWIWQRFCTSLSRTWHWALGLIIVLIIARLQGLVSPLHCWIALAGWFGVLFALAWRSCPGAYEVLAYWDSRTDRADAFANAWWFEQTGEGGYGAQLHLKRQHELLPDALSRLGRDLPLPSLKHLAWPALAFVALILIPPLDGGLIRESELTADAKALAESEGKKLQDRKLDPDKMEGLEQKEKDELQKLQQKIEETAQSLQKPGSQSARDVLSELEKRARDAEKLAEKLGTGDSAWASEQMIAALRGHADTAELGDAVAGRNTESTAKQADELSDKLKDEKLTHETRDRFTATLKDVGEAAQPGDEERTVGQHVINADKNMTQALPQEAGEEFKKLADKMRVLAQREKTREELEKLAQQLRDSGSKIAGQGQKGGMQQLSGNQNNQNQNQQGQQQQQQQGGQGQPMMAMPNAPQMQPMQMPGLNNSNAPQGQGTSTQNLPIMTPVPGTGQPNAQQMAVSPNQNGGQPKPGQPMLIAPVPGTNPGQKPNAMMLMGVIPGAAQGGLNAGSGTAQMGQQQTQKTNAGQSAMVNAQRNAEGASSVRTIEGQARQEQASRTSQQTALEAIAAEENALDESALPAARREQVRRYFNELRQRFERGS